MIRRLRSRFGALLLALLIANLTLLALDQTTVRAVTPSFVTIQGDKFTLNGSPILIKGSNYYKRNTPWAEMWKQWYGPQVEQEISEGYAKLGINTLRVLVPYGDAHTWTDPVTGAVYDQSLHRLQEMVQIAGKYGMRVIITLFDFYNEWPAAGTAEEAANFRYLRDIIETFRNDDRVLAWDLHNEPDNYTRWLNDNRQELIIDWLARMNKYVRQLDQNHLVTIGLGRYQNFWYDEKPGLPKMIDMVDFVSFHGYTAPTMMQEVRDIKSRTNKPILLEETGWPTAPTYISRTYTEQDQLWFYQIMVDTVNKEGLAGAVQWLMMDLTAGPSLRASDYADWMGLIRWDGSLKPAGDYYASWHAPNLTAATTSDLPYTGKLPNPDQVPIFFADSNHFVTSYFKDMWLKFGGLEIYGLPLTEPFTEGKHNIQFFERGVMELYLEARTEPGFQQLSRDDQLQRIVRLKLLGRTLTEGRDFPPIPAFTSDSRHWYFPETSHSLSEGFLYYWQKQGGLLRFGYPISEEMSEVSATDGKVHTVQYFERARFEYHPENAGTPYETQLGQLGREEMLRRGWTP